MVFFHNKDVLTILTFIVDIFEELLTCIKKKIVGLSYYDFENFAWVKKKNQFTMITRKRKLLRMICFDELIHYFQMNLFKKKI